MTLPRLLNGLGPSPPRPLDGAAPSSIGYDRHLAVHGELPPAGRAALLGAELESSGLRGRGGAGFPLSLKLAAVSRGRGRPVVLVNGCEGEPMSSKDRLLLSCAPHLVLDGAQSLAAALGTRDVIVAVSAAEHGLAESVRSAIGERPRSPGSSFDVIAVPGGYVSGQETALVRWCNEGVAKPVSLAPRVSERGVGRRPTFVSNAETVAHVALIARHGADWFRTVGTADDPGSALVTVSGAVREPGVYELEQGEPLGSLLAAAGGASEHARAFLIGGYAGGWIDAAHESAIRLAPAQLRRFGARLGPGIVVVLGESACPVAEITQAMSWLARQSAGQCGPCVHGLTAIADALTAVRDARVGRDARGGGDGGDGRDGRGRRDGRDGRGGRDGARALAQVTRWSEQVSGRGACAHPDGAAAFVGSALRVFGEELSEHAAGRRCEVCNRRPARVWRQPAGAAVS